MEDPNCPGFRAHSALDSPSITITPVPLCVHRTALHHGIALRRYELLIFGGNAENILRTSVQTSLYRKLQFIFATIDSWI